MIGKWFKISVSLLAFLSASGPFAKTPQPQDPEAIILLPMLPPKETPTPQAISTPIPVNSGVETGNTNHRRPPKGLSFWDKKSGTWKLIKKNQ